MNYQERKEIVGNFCHHQREDGDSFIIVMFLHVFLPHLLKLLIDLLTLVYLVAHGPLFCLAF